MTSAVRKGAAATHLYIEPVKLLLGYKVVLRELCLVQQQVCEVLRESFCLLPTKAMLLYHAPAEVKYMSRGINMHTRKRSPDSMYSNDCVRL